MVGNDSRLLGVVVVFVREVTPVPRVIDVGQW